MAVKDKKPEISAITDFIVETINEYNHIERVISASDRDSAIIDSLRTAVIKSRQNNQYKKEFDTLLRILDYFQATNAGIKNAYSIMFKNGHIWNVEYSASVRSDRMEGLAARLSKDRSDKNYIVIGEYGKSEKTRKRFRVDPRYNTSVVSLEEFLDDLLYEVYSYKKDGTKRLKLSESPMSRINGNRGTKWEDCIAKSLNDSSFLPYIRNQILRLIEQDEGFQRNSISSCSAKVVGMARKKPDVEVTITLNNNRVIEKIVSVKASGQNIVSVHQASAKDFVTALGMREKEDKMVIDALEKFQEYGNTSKMNTAEETALKEYFLNPANYQRLLKWVFQGISAKSVDYFILHTYERDDNRVASHTKAFRVNEYMNKVKKTSKQDAAFGTGLCWTYKSKKKNGKKVNDIQLKVPIIF